MKTHLLLAAAVCSCMLALSGHASAVSAPNAAGGSGATSPNATGSSASSPMPTPASGKPLAPEFGPSVTFDTTDVPLQLSDLRGKMTIVFFFQSWCPICNRSAPRLMKQMSDAFGSDPAVALVALKCDGGTPAEAKAYYKEHGADLSQWTVGSDEGGLYYQRVVGTNSLWGFAIIDEGGHVVDHGDAFSHYDRLPIEYPVANASMKQKSPKTAAFLAPDDAMPIELKPIAHAAEMGHVIPAIRALKSLQRGKTKDAATKMQQTLVDELSARVDQSAADLKSDDTQMKYDAYHFLRSMSMMNDLAPGKAAKAALASLKKDKDAQKDFAKQERAEVAFWAMMSKAEHIEVAMRKSQLPDALKQFATAYTGTSYGERAANEAQTIEAGTLAK